MIKVESILKWKVEGSLLKKLKMVRSQILSKNPDAVAIPDKDLHVTLVAGQEWQKFRRKFQNTDLDEPSHRMDIEVPYRSMEKGVKKSWYVRMKHQQDWQDYVMDPFQGKSPDPNRVFHISLANLTGKTGDSIAIVEGHLKESVTESGAKEVKKFVDKNFEKFNLQLRYTEHLHRDHKDREGRGMGKLNAAKVISSFKKLSKLREFINELPMLTRNGWKFILFDKKHNHSIMFSIWDMDKDTKKPIPNGKEDLWIISAYPGLPHGDGWKKLRMFKV